MEAIERYFAGEKLHCTIGIIIALVSILLAVYFLMTQKPMLKGVAYAFLPISLFLLIICSAIVLRTPGDLLRVKGFYQSNAELAKENELPRMEKVMQNFKTIKMIELGFLFAGILLAAFFWKSQIISGVGIGIVIQSAILYGFDLAASARGSVYFEFLEKI